MYYLMPPVSFRSASQFFMPDYELLLLCDRVVMDEMSFNALVERPATSYLRVAETFRALKADERIEFADFNKILQDNAALHKKMVEHDLQILDQWISPLRDSLDIWRHFSRTAIDWPHLVFGGETWFSSHTTNRRELAHGMLLDESRAQYLATMIDEALQSSAKRKKKEYRIPLREVLAAYLGYVNANLILGNELNIGFHDWQDFSPFYSAKFLSVGREVSEVQKQRHQMETMFTVSFPDLAITKPSALLKALNHKRIEELRRLIDDAVAGRVIFDHKFARDVLREVLGSERKSRKLRSVVGYLTLPIGFIPWIGTPAQKLIEEGVGSALERKLKHQHRWFYLLSDIAESEFE